MNRLPSLFLENDAIDAEIEAFCASDPEYQEAKRRFYTLVDEIEKRGGYELSSRFEQCWNTYLCRTADLHYLFGLGFRQEVLHAIGAN